MSLLSKKILFIGTFLEYLGKILCTLHSDEADHLRTQSEDIPQMIAMFISTSYIRLYNVYWGLIHKLVESMWSISAQYFANLETILMTIDKIARFLWFKKIISEWIKALDILIYLVI